MPWLGARFGRSEDLGQVGKDLCIELNGYGVQDYSANHRKKIREKTRQEIRQSPISVSCGGRVGELFRGDLTGSGGGRGWRKADGGGPAWRWVGRLGRRSCGQAAIGRTGRGWAWSVRAGPDRRPKLHRVRAVVGRVGGVGRRSGHAVSGLKSNASGASRSRGGYRGGRGRPGPVGL